MVHSLAGACCVKTKVASCNIAVTKSDSVPTLPSLNQLSYADFPLNPESEVSMVKVFNCTLIFAISHMSPLPRL